MIRIETVEGVHILKQVGNTTHRLKLTKDEAWELSELIQDYLRGDKAMFEPVRIYTRLLEKPYTETIKEILEEHHIQYREEQVVSGSELSQYLFGKGIRMGPVLQVGHDIVQVGYNPSYLKQLIDKGVFDRAVL